MGSVRLVRYIAEHLPEPSRMAVQHWIDDAYVRVNGIARKAARRSLCACHHSNRRDCAQKTFRSIFCTKVTIRPM